jgi:hypothetical protein
MALQQHGGSSNKSSHVEGTTEFEILKSSHRYALSRFPALGFLTRRYRFLRADDEGARDLSWNDKVAKKYYDSLYKEFAVCDLKHYKSGNVRQPLVDETRNSRLTKPVQPALANRIRGSIRLRRDDVWEHQVSSPFPRTRRRQFPS